MEPGRWVMGGNWPDNTQLQVPNEKGGQKYIPFGNQRSGLSSCARQEQMVMTVVCCTISRWQSA